MKPITIESIGLTVPVSTLAPWIGNEIPPLPAPAPGPSTESQKGIPPLPAPHPTPAPEPPGDVPSAALLRSAAAQGR